MPRQQLKLSFYLPESSADWAGQALVTHFPDGLLFSQPSKKLVRATGWPKLKLSPASLENLKSQIQQIGGTQLRVHAERVRDWVTEYKSRFPVQTLGRFVILPSWRKKTAVPKNKFPIVLLPGQAFGTGLHNSTRLMLGAIGKEKPQSVLDIGAGSGILGLACLRLGAKKILSLEIEEAACAEMAGNAKLNGYKPSRFAVRCGAFPEVMRGLKLKPDLLLANIVTPVLCALMKSMVSQCARGSVLLFSGIHTAAEARQVSAAARAAGLKVSAQTSKGNWFCIRAIK